MTLTNTRDTRIGARRLLLTGGFALTLTAAPLADALSAPDPTGPALATCPQGEVIDPITNACKPSSTNPLNPSNATLQPGGLTSQYNGAGSLPTVDGIPCNSNDHGGGSSSQCIGLQESQSTFHQPHSSINGQIVTAPTS